MGIWIMANVTFREAARKKILWTAFLAGIGFLLVFGIGLRFQVEDFRRTTVPPFLRYLCTRRGRRYRHARRCERGQQT